MVLHGVLQGGGSPFANVSGYELSGRRADSGRHLSPLSLTAPSPLPSPPWGARGQVVTLVLASTSPRRYQILSLLGLPFLMVPPAYQEVGARRAVPLPARLPAEEALYQARQKAACLVSRFPDAVILGSDTLINLDGRLIGKPSSPNGARAILQRLRGRTHDVITAVCLLESPPPSPSPLEGEGMGATRHPSPGAPIAPPIAMGHGEGRGEGAIGKCFEWVETAHVTMRDFTETELDAYLATGD